MHRAPAAVIVLAVGAAIAPAARSEEVEHPVYRSWARHKVGTTVTLREVTGQEGGTKTVETILRLRLSKLDGKAAVIEQVTESDATGERVKNPPQEFTYRRQFILLPGVRKEDVGRPVGALDKGEEMLELAGKTYKAQWYDTKGKTEAGPSFTRAWYSDEVPGLLLKSTTRVPAAKKVTTMELVEIKVP
jgi:hypothetical protein